MNDWNVRNVSGVSGMTGMSGKTGETVMSHRWISRRSPCLLCIEFLFWNEGLSALWNVVAVLEELIVEFVELHGKAGRS